jgi:AraC-like DNA-binding protein
MSGRVCLPVKAPFRLTYMAPAAPLAGLVSSYYLFETGLPVLADVLRAETAQVRFLLAGDGQLSYGGRPFEPMPFASLAGPSTSAIRFEARGPLRILGAGMLPAGWAALVGEDADAYADRLVDLGGLAPYAVNSAFHRMAEATSHREIVAAADALFLLLSMEARIPPLWLTRTTDDWLASSPSPDVNVLVQELDMSARQVERMVRRVYGASPKLLSRKYRALQAAVRLGLNPEAGWEAAAAGAFYDQSHFIRDFRSFVGLTPGQFVTHDSPWLTRLTIAKRQALPTLPKLARVS